MLRIGVKILALFAALSLLSVNKSVADSSLDTSSGNKAYQQVLYYYFQGDHENTLLYVALAEQQNLHD